MNEQLNSEEEIRARRRQRILQMQQEKERQMLRRKYLKKFAPLACGAVFVLLIIFMGVKISNGSSANNSSNAQGTEKNAESEGSNVAGSSNKQGILQINEPVKDSSGTESGLQENETGREAVGAMSQDTAENRAKKEYSAKATGNTRQLGEEIISTHAMLIDLSSGDILAQKDAMTRINPASMTKILTVLVAAEHIEKEDLEDTFTMTLEITDYGYVNDCSSVGFLEGEAVTVRDLFYGTILKSGADAAVGLATYVAGSHEAFVEMMNEKLSELGLSDTAHFTNCVGIYDEEHYCTIYDMAMILEAAMDNELCREVLSEHTYTTAATKQHPEEITISNWFLRRIEDKDTGGEVLYAKTGYVKESGNCAASYAEDETGKGYICVTAGANHYWKCIYDHVDIYKQFLG